MDVFYVLRSLAVDVLKSVTGSEKALTRLCISSYSAGGDNNQHIIIQVSYLLSEV